MNHSRTLFFVIIPLLLLTGLNILEAASTQETLLEGKQLEKQGENAKAVALYQKHLAQSPDDTIYVACIALLGKMTRFRDARTLADTGLKNVPASTGLLNISGLIHFRLGDSHRAIADWEAVLRIEKDNRFALDWLRKARANAPDRPTGSGTKALDIPPPEAAKEPEGAGSENPETTTSPDILTIRVADNPGSLEDQIKKAKDIYTVMISTDENDLETLERLHLQVICGCPDSPLAQKSIWMLSNMLEFAFPEPQVKKQVTLLEHLRDKYPDCPAGPSLMNRLVNAYRGTNQVEKLVSLYSTALGQAKVDDREWVIHGLEYAKVLKETGQTQDACTTLQEVIRRDGNKNSFEATVAKSLLGKWQ